MPHAQSLAEGRPNDIVSQAISAVVSSDASIDLRAPVSRLGELLAVLAVLAAVAGVGALVVVRPGG